MNYLLISLKKKHWKAIASGVKKYEIRNNLPRRVSLPFTCLCSVGGNIVGSFVCSDVSFTKNYEMYAAESGLSVKEIKKYAANREFYAWHISSVKTFDGPLSLIDVGIKRVPQNYKYITMRRELLNDRR